GMLKIFGGLFAARQRGVEDGTATPAGAEVYSSVTPCVTVRPKTGLSDTKGTVLERSGGP
ncbi:hypothetical protein, partial [Pseudomonas helleri]|uniref:hypothetical protein n=1 Tax=Pseudomonas helleri TaxID=1608996 RepID=UPI003F994EEB